MERGQPQYWLHTRKVTIIYNVVIGLDPSIILGIQIILGDREIVKLGIVQSTMESSMFIFVFMWTPTLSVEVDNKFQLQSRKNIHLKYFANF